MQRVLQHTPEQEEAYLMYAQQISITDIANTLNRTRGTITNWIKKFDWNKSLNSTPNVVKLQIRLDKLLATHDKSAAQVQEMETILCALNPNFAKRIRPPKTPKTLSDGAVVGRKGKGKRQKTKKVKNDVSHLTQKDFDAKFKNLLFKYQQRWRDAKISWQYAEKVDINGKQVNFPRIRQILKSRQVGATWYFAAEAFEDAVLSGDNQIFLSASKNQAGMFREYIKDFAANWFGIELTGTDEIKLSNGATLYFLATSSRTAQSYHGHLYIDEYFWMRGFDELNKVAKGMASQKRWRSTYFSTPSALSHQAYPMWKGKKFTKQFGTKIDTTHKHLRYGAVGEDRVWRNMVTIKDAQEDGCNLFDIEELRLEYSKEEFHNLFMCGFVDDADSIFPLGKLQSMMVEAEGAWLDFMPDTSRPLDMTPVWIGYDPARSRDDASIVVVAPPNEGYDKFRVLETIRYSGKDFKYQAMKIKELTERYNVEEIAMDVSGIGWGAYERVQNFFPSVVPINYTPKVKEKMVAKMLDVIHSDRLEYDIEQAQTLVPSFMSIGRTTTGSGSIVINASRSGDTGHADVAFALMHAVFQKPSEYDGDFSSGWSELATAQ